MRVFINKTLIAAAMAVFGIGCASAQLQLKARQPRQAAAAASAITAEARAPRAAAATLVTNPAGVRKDYGMSLYMYVNALTPDWDEYDLKNQLAFDPDGKTVWFKDFFFNEMQGWAKGEISGGKVVVRGGQYVANDAAGHKLYLFPFTIGTNNDAVIADSVAFSYSGGKLANADVYMGLWYYTGSTSVTLVDVYAHKYVFNEVTTKTATVPSDATVEKYLLTFNDGWRGGEERKVVDVARQGSDIYVSGLAFDSRSDFVKGTVSGSEATFESGQTLAGNSSYWLKLVGATGNSYTPTSTFKFLIASDGSMALANGVLCAKYMFDGGNHNVASDVRLVKYAGDVPAVPATPKYLKFDSKLGRQFTFVQPHTDVNGNELNPDSLYYRVYVDGKLYTFTPDKYTTLPAAMSEVPFGYYDSYTFNDVYNKRYKLFYLSANDDWGTLEVESLYRVNGVENVSPEKAKVINPSGVEAVVSGATAVATTYVNLLGQTVASPEKGRIYIKTVRYTDGTTAVSKVVF